PAPSLDLVLRADPKIRRIDDRAIERVVAAWGVYAAIVQPDLLGPHADAHRAAAGVCAWRSDDRVVGQSHPDETVVRAIDGPGQQVADSEEAGDEARGGSLIQALRVAELLVPAAV